MIKASALLLAALLLGCSSQSVEPQAQAHSGFLGDYYAQLRPAISVSGQPVMRWISPTLQRGSYKKVMISPSQFYPEPKTSDKLYTETLDQILSYFDTDLYQDVSAVMPVVTTASPQTLKLRVAITAVSAQVQGLKPYEVIPVALLAAGAAYATGERDESVSMSVEYEVTDSVTGEVVAVGMREGFGKPLARKSDTVTLDELAPVLDTWSDDAGLFLQRLK